MLTQNDQFARQRDAHVEKLRFALRSAILESGISQREVEKRNNYKKGYLSQVLKGHITLTLRHVLGILLALEIDFAEFFGRTFRDSAKEQPMDVLMERIASYDAHFEDVRAELDELRQAVRSGQENAIDSEPISKPVVSDPDGQ